MTQNPQSTQDQLEQRKEPPVVIGEATVPIELQGRRMWLHMEAATGKTDDGREFVVSSVVGGLRLLIAIENRHYAIPLIGLIDKTLDTDASASAQEEP